MAYYLVVTIMSTVGFGDITASNNWEAVLSIITMMISSVFFAYSLNNIGQIFKNLSAIEDEI